MLMLLVILFFAVAALRITFGLIGLVLRIAIALSPIGLLFYILRPRRIRRYYY